MSVAPATIKPVTGLALAATVVAAAPTAGAPVSTTSAAFLNSAPAQPHKKTTRSGLSLIN